MLQEMIAKVIFAIDVFELKARIGLSGHNCNHQYKEEMMLNTLNNIINFKRQ